MEYWKGEADNSEKKYSLCLKLNCHYYILVWYSSDMNVIGQNIIFIRTFWIGKIFNFYLVLINKLNSSVIGCFESLFSETLYFFKIRFCSYPVSAVWELESRESHYSVISQTVTAAETNLLVLKAEIFFKICHFLDKLFYLK